MSMHILLTLWLAISSNIFILTVGKYKAAVVAACRSAIKDHDSTTLLKVIRGGATT